MPALNKQALVGVKAPIFYAQYQKQKTNKENRTEDLIFVKGYKPWEGKSAI